MNEIGASSRETVNTQVPVGENVETQDDGFDWQSDNVQPHQHPPQIDPWQSATDRIALRREGPNITPEALRSQLVGRFADIPQVHTFVELDQRRNQNELIEFLAADSYLYPSQNKTELLKRLQVIAAEKAKKEGNTG